MDISVAINQFVLLKHKDLGQYFNLLLQTLHKGCWILSRKGWCGVFIPIYQKQHLSVKANIN